MTTRHESLPSFLPAPRVIAQSSLGYVAKLSRLVLRAKQTRRATFRAAVIIRSGVSQLYAMAGLSLSTAFETARVGARAAFGARQCAGLAIS